VATHALNRHLVLIGFMGAGKTTIGEEVARRLGRPFVDLDTEVERRTGKSVVELFEDAEAEFRLREEEVAFEVVRRKQLSVIALGGGAVLSQKTRSALRSEFTVLLEVDGETAWARVSGSDRPLAQVRERFDQLFAERAPVYDEVANARAHDADDVVLAAGSVRADVGALQLLESFVEPPAALVTEPVVAGIHGADAQLAFSFAETHELPSGEGAKQLHVIERLWRALRIGRDGTIVALGGGSLTDAAGFAAATYLRGVDWVPVPTTLIGQVDAAIGGKTAIDIPEGKNLVGAFHWPARIVIDPALLETLPANERLNGMAEVVKTGLLANESLWELADADLVRRCAAFKSALCLRDPHDRGPRHALNLGHTFAHALEAAAGYELPHGRAVALGLLAALRLSGRPTDPVDEVLRPRPIPVDGELAWQALLRDKKGPLKLILLGDEGAFETTVPVTEVRRALDELIA
jgi:shikimate kinase/3-dehydroquinate synthase